VPERNRAPGNAVTVIVDAENVRRSQWPNLGRGELLELARAWAERTAHGDLVVFDGRPPEAAPDTVSAEPSADDWIAEHAPGAGAGVARRSIREGAAALAAEVRAHDPRSAFLRDLLGERE